MLAQTTCAGLTLGKGLLSQTLGRELGPFGATEHGDADTWILSYQANGIVGAVEAIESDVPAVLLREDPGPDTGAGADRRA